MALLDLDGPLVGSPHATQHAEEDDPTWSQLRMPPPEPMPGNEVRYEKLRGATRFLGASTWLVPPMTLTRAVPELSSPPGSGGGDRDGDRGDTTTSLSPPTATTTRKEERFWDFEVEYTPLRTGFVPVGGLRVLLLKDRVRGAEEAYLEKRAGAPVVLKEWDAIGEIWVKS